MTSTYHLLHNGYRNPKMFNGYDTKAFGKNDMILPQEINNVINQTTFPTKSLLETNGISLVDQRPLEHAVDASPNVVSQLEEPVSYSRKYLNELLNSKYEDSFVPDHQLGPDYILPATSWTSTRPEDPVKLRMGFVGITSKKPMSLVTFFEQRVKKSGDKLALSVERDGQWIHWTYDQYWADVCIAAKGFLKLGLERYHAIAVLGFNAPEWVISILATVFAGGITTGIYATNKPDACQHVLAHSRANIVIVENEQQLQKVLEVRHSLPCLKAIIQYTGTPTHEDVFSWEDVMRLGRSMEDEPLWQRIRSLAINQCASLVYTSGTTGLPKAVMISHDNGTFMSEFITTICSYIEEEETIVSYMPMNHMAAQIMDLYMQVTMGGHVYFARPDAMRGSLLNTMLEVQPTILMSVPRMYEKIRERLEDFMKNANVFQRATLKWAFRQGTQYTKSVLNGRPSKPAGYGLAERIITKIRRKLGFGNTRLFLIGGAPTSEENLKFFYGLNIILMEAYGLSETTGSHISNTMESYRCQSVGKYSIHNETKLVDCGSDQGKEICFRGRNVFMGYMYDEKKTIEAIDSDHWLHSGDMGRMDDDGFIFVTGRLKELIITAGGENIGPIVIEDNVKAFLPVVSQAIVIGDRRKFLSMLLTLKTEVDPLTMAPTDKLSPVALGWCQMLGSKAKTVQDILQSQDNKVMKAIQEGIDRTNEKAVSRACHIQKWSILPRDFSMATDELGPTGKLKRHTISELYKNVIDAFYANC